MKIAEFRAGLHALDGMSLVVEFLHRSSASDTKMIAAFSKSISAALAGKTIEPRQSVSVGDVISSLEYATDVAMALKANAFAKDCRTFIGALQPFSEFDSACVADEIAAGPLPKPKTARKKAKPERELRAIADELASVSGSKDATQLIAKISDKKRFSVKELKIISARYLGFGIDKVAHKKLVEMLNRRNRQDALDASRQRLESEVVL